MGGKNRVNGLTAPNARKVKFLFSNMAYRATVYKTGVI